MKAAGPWTVSSLQGLETAWAASARCLSRSRSSVPDPPAPLLPPLRPLLLPLLNPRPARDLLPLALCSGGPSAAIALRKMRSPPPSAGPPSRSRFLACRAPCGAPCAAPSPLRTAAPSLLRPGVAVGCRLPPVDSAGRRCCRRCCWPLLRSFGPCLSPCSMSPFRRSGLGGAASCHKMHRHSTQPVTCALLHTRPHAQPTCCSRGATKVEDSMAAGCAGAASTSTSGRSCPGCRGLGGARGLPAMRGGAST